MLGLSTLDDKLLLESVVESEGPRRTLRKLLPLYHPYSRLFHWTDPQKPATNHS